MRVNVQDQLRPLLSIDDVARIVGCSNATVWRAIRSGRLHAARIGGRGHYRVDVEDLRRWVR